MLPEVPFELSVMTTVAARAPPAVGLKLTLMLQFADAAKEAPQV
jgi:hypothetical protein